MFAKWLLTPRSVVLLCCIFFITFLHAQQHSAEGRITSAYDNAPIEGVHVRLSVRNEAAVSTRFLEKANFLRLQQLTAGYRFTFAKGRIDQLQISAIAQNLFVITKYSGFDPEVNTSAGSNTNASYGIDYTTYPRARMFTLNIGVMF